MNKFIRTNEGIYELKKSREIIEEWDIAGNPHLVEYEYDYYSGESDEYDLGVYISQGDTIKELCDKFVITFNDKSIEPKQFKIFETALEELNKCDNKYCPVLKGAIWTDEGLTYVAETNENGELILL